MEELARRRTRYAYVELQRWIEVPAYADAFKRAQSLPIEVRTEGLTIALLVLKREGGTASLALGRLLASWLIEHWRPGLLPEAGGRRSDPIDDLVERCVQANRVQYQAAQREAILFLDQVKLVASALKGE